MTEFHLPFGKTTLTAHLPDDYAVTLIAPRDVPPPADIAAMTQAALDNLVGQVDRTPLSRAQRVAIAIGDKTRPVPHPALRVLLTWIEGHGVEPRDITLFLATGTHVPVQADEFPSFIPADIRQRYRIVSHDCDDQDNLAHLGETSRGTPVWINQEFLAADWRIVVGNIEPHQFMGFSGGVKAAAIGLAGRATIDANHAMMNEPEAGPCQYATNPVRQDVEEIGRMMGIHLALNTVLNRDKRIVHVLAGEPVSVMEAGIPIARELFEVHVEAPFDLMIASPGGHPKDINLYQAQKSLGHSTPVMQPDGVVILVAACPEGLGSASYEAWLEGMTSYEQILERFAREPFRLGPHKAFQIARDASRLREVILVTAMSPELVRRTLLTPAASLDEALAHVLPTLPRGARIGVMPAANVTIPVLDH